MSNVYNARHKQDLEKFINQVAETILQSNLSLFIGAGSSIQYDAMSWNSLVDTLVPGLCSWSNPDKAQYAELKGNEVKAEIAKIISQITINACKKDTYLNFLLNFDYRSLWTTNYDSVIENVLEHKAKTYIPIYKYSHFPLLTHPGGYFLYKINGSQAAPETIVITHEDFIDYRKSHEAYLILLKRELLCNNFLFLGCSFDDDILRICIKDILNCIQNDTENYSVNHYAIIVESKKDKLNYICQDMNRHYKINCLCIDNPAKAYIIAYGISSRVKYTSIFVSGAKRFERYSIAENNGMRVCRDMVNAFMAIEEFPFKFVSGMGMSIGHFISGTIKQKCKGKNLNRFLQMEPFPFTNREENDAHRKGMISKAGIFIFLYGDYDERNTSIQENGMWKEYEIAKADSNNIIIPIPCGTDSISDAIFQAEILNETSFSFKYKDIVSTFNCEKDNSHFFEILVEKVLLATREKMDQVIEDIVTSLL